MSAEETTEPNTRAVGPLAIRPTPVWKQLVGYVVAAAGLSIGLFGADLLAADGTAALAGATFHLALGAFAILNGLYLGGVRYRR